MKNSTGTISTLSVLLLGLTALGSLPAAADEQTVPQTGGGGADQAAGGLQEVLVTATRHEEALSKVPISVTALTQEDMDMKGIKDITDVVRFTPGVSIDTAGTNSISIRGISSSAGADTTGIYLDDTPIQMRSVGFNPDDTLPKTFDLDRVEVLRGPQGTLFGAGSEGGTVRYILNQPSLTRSSTYLRSEVSYTENGQPSYELGIAHGGPIVDGTFGWRGSAWYRYDGGWINRVDPTTGAQTEANANHDETAMLRLAAIWAPVASLQITPSIIYENIKKHDMSTYWPAYSDPSAGQFNNATPERIPVSDEWYLPALKITWDLGKSQVISNTSYFHRKELTGYQGTVYDLGFFQLLGWPSNPLSGGLGCLADTPPDCPWYPLMDGNGIHLPAGFTNFQTPNVMTNTQENITQEIRWQSSDESSRWRWTVGVFLQQSKEGSIEELKDPNNELDGPNGLFNYMYGETASDFFGAYFSCPDNSAYPSIPACDIYYNKSNTVDKQVAVFGEVSYAFSEQWRLTVGERVAHTTFDITNYSDGLENYGPLGPRSGSTSDNPSTPKATLAFQMNPSNMFYASYAKGFRVGGGNPALPSYCDADLANNGYPNGAPLTYRPDTTQNYELGAKNAIGSNFRIATSVYYIKWKDIQQSVYIAGSCGLQFIDNVGEAVAKGFDLQAEAVFGPLYLDLATGYTSARFSTDSPIVNTSGQPLVANGDAISGQASINGAPGTSPPWTVAIGAEYRFHPFEHDAFVRADWQYASQNNWQAAIQDPRTAQYVVGQVPQPYSYSSTTFTSLRAGVNLGDWLLSAFVDNLTNTHPVINYAMSQADTYVTGITAPTVQQNQFTYRPRTFGLNATWKIGR
jgi:outer membrane receptor protein involved in Fe transport